MTLSSLFLFLFLTLHKVSNEIILINPAKVQAETFDPFAAPKNIISGTGNKSSISGTGSQNSISGYGGQNSGQPISNPSRAGLLLQGRTGGGANNGTNGGLDFPSPIGLYNLSGVASRFLYILQVIAVPILALIVLIAAWKILVGATSGKSDTLKSGIKLIGYAAIYFAILLVASGIPYVIKQIIGF